MLPRSGGSSLCSGSGSLRWRHRQLQDSQFAPEYVVDGLSRAADELGQRRSIWL
jgi:hypothetical protein